MELMEIASKIEEKIHLLEKGREVLQEKTNRAVEASGEYEKALAITLLKLENKAITEWGGYDCTKIAKGNMDKIAKGMCWKEKMEMDKAEKEYKITLVKLEMIKTEMNGYQSVNRYIKEV